MFAKFADTQIHIRKSVKEPVISRPTRVQPRARFLAEPVGLGLGSEGPAGNEVLRARPVRSFSAGVSPLSACSAALSCQPASRSSEMQPDLGFAQRLLLLTVVIRALHGKSTLDKNGPGSLWFAPSHGAGLLVLNS